MPNLSLGVMIISHSLFWHFPFQGDGKWPRALRKVALSQKNIRNGEPENFVIKKWLFWGSDHTAIIFQVSVRETGGRTSS